MKKHIILLSLIFFAVNLNAQVHQNKEVEVIQIPQGGTDLKKMNLKGSVVSVAEYDYPVKESFGEWLRGDESSLAHYSVFNNNGNFIIDAKKNEESDRGVNRFLSYSYNECGQISEINLVYGSNWPVFSGPEDVKWYRDHKRHYDQQIKYEYNGGGELKSITYYDTRIYECIIAKDVYTHNANGFEIVYYKWDGRKDVDKQCSFIKKDRSVIKVDRGKINKEIYDGNWRLIESLSMIGALNGSIQNAKYYGYNDNGDLRVESSTASGIAAIKNLESLYPYIGNSVKTGDISFYEYEYDANGNWIIRKTYRKRKDEIILAKWTERVITYSEGDADGEKIAEDFYKRALPDRASVPTFRGWAASVLKYQPSSALGEYLKRGYSSDYVDINMRFIVTPSGRIIAPTSIEKSFTEEYGVIWYNAENVPSSSREAICKDIEEMLQKFLTDFKDAPKGECGKNADAYQIHVKMLRDKNDVSIRDKWLEGDKLRELTEKYAND